MKLKLQLLSLCFIFCIFMMSAPVNAEKNNIFESYDNTRVIYGYLENGVTYIPIGEIWRQFGNQLSFDVNEQKIFFSTNQGAITLGFQSAIGEINGETITLSNPTKKIQNTVYASVSVNAGIHLTHQRRNKIDPPVCLVSNRFRFLLCP